jgi:hypothetical protein
MEREREPASIRYLAAGCVMFFQQTKLIIEMFCFFYYFNKGHNSARERHLQVSAESALNSKVSEVVDNCFFSGYEESVSAPAASRNGSTANGLVTVKGPKHASADQFSICTDSLRPLLQKNLNSFCDTVYDGECSMDGFYQPKLPNGRNGHFIASAMFKYPWYFLEMPQTATINDFQRKAQDMCAMSYRDVLKYNDNLNTTVKKDEIVQYYCFLSSYITVLLECEFSVLSMPYHAVTIFCLAEVVFISF